MQSVGYKLARYVPSKNIPQDVPFFLHFRAAARPELFFILGFFLGKPTFFVAFVMGEILPPTANIFA